MAFLSGIRTGGSAWPTRRPTYKYVNFSTNNPECIHVVLSTRAYNTIIAETLSHDAVETGGVLIGHIYRRVWYVTDVIPPGLEVHRTWAFFHMDLPFVNFLAGKVADVYAIRPTILGFWHRHPGSMDVFSEQDFDTISDNERASRYGLLTMLVNIDPQLRMTFYHAHNGILMKLHYDQGDEYFPPELLQLATPQQLINRRTSGEGGRDLSIAPNRTLSPEQLPRHVVFRPRPEAQAAAAQAAAAQAAAAQAAAAAAEETPAAAAAPAPEEHEENVPAPEHPAEASAAVQEAPTGAAREPVKTEETVETPAAPVHVEPAGETPGEEAPAEEAFDPEKQYALLRGLIEEMGCRLAADRAEDGDPAMETTEQWLKRYLRQIEDCRSAGRVPDSVAMKRLAREVCSQAVEGEVIVDFFPTGERLRQLLDSPEAQPETAEKEDGAEEEDRAEKETDKTPEIPAEQPLNPTEEDRPNE